MIKHSGHSDASHLHWYLVHCKPNCVKLARQNLTNQNFDVFLPMQKITKRKANQFQTILRPLFPGYLFVQLDSLAGQWRKINNTRGVARLVQLGANPCPLPDAVIAALLERCDAEHVLQKPGRWKLVKKRKFSKALSQDSLQRSLRLSLIAGLSSAGYNGTGDSNHRRASIISAAK